MDAKAAKLGVCASRCLLAEVEKNDKYVGVFPELGGRLRERHWDKERERERGQQQPGAVLCVQLYFPPPSRCFQHTLCRVERVMAAVIVLADRLPAPGCCDAHRCNAAACKQEHTHTRSDAPLSAQTHTLMHFNGAFKPHEQKPVNCLIMMLSRDS